MLGIASAKSMCPYSEDKHSEPNTLPSQFVGPDTHYCQPYPHWKTPPTKQVTWIPTYIPRFRATIPNDCGELSTLLCNLSDEQIVTLLHDGPFQLAQTAWRDMKKMDEKVEAMRAEARCYRQVDKVSG